MGCGCGSGRRQPSPRSHGVAQQAVIDPRPHMWEVAFPNGARQRFATEWQANAARAVGDGDMPRKVYEDEQYG